MCVVLLVALCMCICARAHACAIFRQGNTIKFKKSSWGTFPACFLCVQKFMQVILNTLRMGDADLRFYITTVQDR